MNKLNSILLIDDDPITVFMNEKLLKKLNIANEIITAVSGAEGLTKLWKYKETHHNNYPDAILVDLNMPGINGFRFIKELNKINSDTNGMTRIAVLTNSTDHNDLTEIFSLGIKSYFVKPLSEDQILKWLTEKK